MNFEFAHERKKMNRKDCGHLSSNMWAVRMAEAMTVRKMDRPDFRSRWPLAGRPVFLLRFGKVARVPRQKFNPNISNNKSNIQMAINKQKRHSNVVPAPAAEVEPDSYSSGQLPSPGIMN